MPSASLLTLSLVGLLLSACGTQTGTATEEVHVTRAYVIHGTGTLPKLDPSDYPDAAGIARGSNLTVSQAMRLMAVHDLFRPALSEVERSYRTTYAQSGFLTGNGAFLVFTHAPPLEDLAPFEDLPADTIVYTGAPTTYPRLERLMESAGATLRDLLGDPDIGLQSRMRDDLGSGVVVTYDPTDFTDRQMDDAERAARESLRSSFGLDADLVNFVRDPKVPVYEAE